MRTAMQGHLTRRRCQLDPLSLKGYLDFLAPVER